MANKKSAVRGRRSQHEAERTRARILDRAEKLFSARGFRGVTTRELAKASGVHPYTIQHHFGSKVTLYRAVLGRYNDEVRDRLVRVMEGRTDLPDAIDAVVDELFEFLLDHRDWLRVHARVALGEALPPGTRISSGGWIDFVTSAMDELQLGTLKLDLRLWLITVEGMLNHHLLSDARYRQQFGHDLGDARFRHRTKEHLKSVMVSVLEANR